MKIAILNTSDAKGGAAIVSHRLLNGLCESGIDARMIVADKTTDNNRVASASSPSKRRSASLWNGSTFLRKTDFHAKISSRCLPLVSEAMRFHMNGFAKPISFA